MPNSNVLFLQLEMFRQTAAYSFQPPDRPGFRYQQMMMMAAGTKMMMMMVTKAKSVVTKMVIFLI